MTPNTTHSSTPTGSLSSPGAPPAHLDPSWLYLPLTKDRTPIKGYTKKSHPDYWAGATATWEELTTWTGDGKAMGMLVRESGLVVIDCDNKAVFETEGNTAALVYRHGITHLTKLCQDLGHEVPPTYTTRTKSGGYHLYYLQNPDWPLRSSGHRENWHVDVKASPSVFVVVPPSPGYEVIRDLPLAMIPEWLARYLMRLKSHTNPSGGERARELMQRIQDTREAGICVDRGTDLHAEWLGWALDLVANSQQAWNSRIYVTARQLFDVGYTAEEAEDMLLVAAMPWNEREQHNVRRTVGSAWNGHLEKVHGDQHWTYREL